MAKKSESGEFSFLELDNYLTKNVDERGSIVTDNAYSRIDEYIPSGNYMLNAQLSGSLFGGYPNSRCVAIAGENSCLQKNETVLVYIFKSVEDEHSIISENNCR